MMGTYIVKELEETESKKEEGTKIKYKVTAINEETEDKLTLTSNNPITITIGQLLSVVE